MVNEKRLGRFYMNTYSCESVLAEMIEERHALFDDAETAVRDEDNIPIDRGASGKNLRWCAILGDEKLDRKIRGAAWALQRKHPHSYLDAEDIANRIRLKVDHAHAKYPALSATDWEKLSSKIISRECARYSHRMERECKEHLRLISRDSRGEPDGEGDTMHWREHLDYKFAVEEMDRDEQKKGIEEALSRVSPFSRRILELYYRDGIGQRTLAKRLNRPLSSFQSGEWQTAKEEFKKYFPISLVIR